MQNTKSNGFTLIQTLVSVAIFVLLAMSVYQVFGSMTRLISVYRENTAVSQLANQYMEIVHNLPYSSIGTLSGNPSGSLPDLPNAVTAVFNTNTYKIYYAVSYVDDPADGTLILGTDPSNFTDYKQVKLYVQNTTNNVTKSFVTNITPKGLEGLSSGGALFITVFDAVGQPVSGATVKITNASTTPAINLTRTTDGAGNWIEVGLPASSNSYHVVVLKNGYSQDQTYPVSVANPNPIKADSTISAGLVTQISFSIDHLSNLTFDTLDQVCAPIPSVGLAVHGSKLIGTPSLIKFNNSYVTDAAGKLTLNDIEWDNYLPGLTGSSYIVYGSSPIQQIDILPATTQNFTLILGPSSTNSLLAIVQDALGNPIEGATIQLQSSSLTYDVTKVAGGSVWSQNDWSGGSGQTTIGNQTMYSADDGHVDTTTVPTGLRLFFDGLAYSSDAWLTSSTFDSGTASTSYTTLTWQPTSQTASTSIQFQVAANNDNLTWNYAGPDGTSGTYYTVPGTTISSVNNSKRYIRYKAYLSSVEPLSTPVLTSININYVSGCFTPGQVIFTGLQAGTDYSLTVSLPGYQTQAITDLNISGYNDVHIVLTP